SAVRLGHFDVVLTGLWPGPSGPHHHSSYASDRLSPVSSTPRSVYVVRPTVTESAPSLTAWAALSKSSARSLLSLATLSHMAALLSSLASNCCWSWYDFTSAGCAVVSYSIPLRRRAMYAERASAVPARRLRSWKREARPR